MQPDRIERAVRPLAILSWLDLAAMAAQSLPTIPPMWRLLISIGGVAVIAAHIAICIWRDSYSGPVETEADDES